jgi:hypothetical protein
MLDVYAATLGLVLRQDGVGYHRPFTGQGVARSNGVEIRIGRPLNAQETQDLWAAIDADMKVQGLQDWNSNAALISSPEGMRAINLGAMVDNKKFHAIVEKAAAIAIKGDLNVGYFYSDGNLQSNNWKENPDGQDYIQTITSAGRSDVLERARSVLGPRIQQVYEEFSEKYGWGDAGELRFDLQGRSQQARDRGGRFAGRRNANRENVSQQSQEDAGGTGQSASRSQRLEPLPGVPNVRGFNGPDPQLVAVAEEYAKDNGVELARQPEYFATPFGSTFLLLVQGMLWVLWYGVGGGQNGKPTPYPAAPT